MRRPLQIAVWTSASLLGFAILVIFVWWMYFVRSNPLLLNAPKPNIVGKPMYGTGEEAPPAEYVRFQTKANESELVAETSSYLSGEGYRLLGRGRFLNPGSYFFQATGETSCFLVWSDPTSKCRNWLSGKENATFCFVIDYFSEKQDHSFSDVTYWAWSYHEKPVWLSSNTPTCGAQDINKDE